jgi:hypothetical protein
MVGLCNGDELNPSTLMPRSFTAASSLKRYQLILLAFSNYYNGLCYILLIIAVVSFFRVVISVLTRFIRVTNIEMLCLA